MPMQNKTTFEGCALTTVIESSAQGPSDSVQAQVTLQPFDGEDSWVETSGGQRIEITRPLSVRVSFPSSTHEGMTLGINRSGTQPQLEAYPPDALSENPNFTPLVTIHRQASGSIALRSAVRQKQYA